jgi:high affinity Mn2+ porin
VLIEKAYVDKLAERIDEELFDKLSATWHQEQDGLRRKIQDIQTATPAPFDQAIDTLSTPDVNLTDRVGALKYGTGISVDQAITSDIGGFARLGWNDGKTQSLAFTAIDRLASGGVSVKGTRWHRKDDVVATSLTAGGLSAVHREYLAAGGLDFLIGDGRLNYAPEYVWESYYSARLSPGFYTTFDVQRDTNPAYNHDRGPVMIYSVRMHVALGLKPWQPR